MNTRWLKWWGLVLSVCSIWLVIWALVSGKPDDTIGVLSVVALLVILGTQFMGRLDERRR